MWEDFCLGLVGRWRGSICMFLFEKGVGLVSLGCYNKLL